MHMRTLLVVCGLHIGCDGASEPLFEDQKTPLTAMREEYFLCDLAAESGESPPKPFEGDASHQILVVEDSPCIHTVRHVTTSDLANEQVLFTGGHFMAEAGLVVGDNLLACASRIELSDPVALEGTQTKHVIDKVSIQCASRAESAWTPSVTVAGPAGNEWGAWVHSLKAGPQPGEYELLWVRDFTLFPFTTVDEGRPEEDGVYSTVLEVSAIGPVLAIGPTTKVSEGVESMAISDYELPDGTIVPNRGTHEWEEP